MEEFDEHINDLYEDMERLNALYEELCWDHTVRLEFSIDSNESVVASQRFSSLRRR